MCRHPGGGYRVELLSPIKGVKSPVDQILSKNGAAPYHICYRTENIKKAADKLWEMGFMVIAPPARSEVLGGLVSFLYSQEIGLIELIEYL